MAKLHIITINCPEGHSFGGCAYVDGNKTRDQSIAIMREDLEKMTGMPLSQFPCPICHNTEMVFNDMETPYESISQAREFIDALKQQQQDAAMGLKPDANLALFSTRQIKITVIPIDPARK